MSAFFIFDLGRFCLLGAALGFLTLIGPTGDCCVRFLELISQLMLLIRSLKLLLSKSLLVRRLIRF